MSIQNKTTLKTYFNKGDIPTENNFHDLIDSVEVFYLNEVTTDKNKLNLTGVTPGYKVKITEEANRIEQYLGDVGEAGLTLTGSNITGLYNGGYYPSIIFTSGKREYHSVEVSGTSYAVIYYHGSKWVAAKWGDETTISAADGNEDYPWEADWSGTDISITRNPISSNYNWIIIGPNTFNLKVHCTLTYNTDEINFVPLLNGAEAAVTIGWIREGDKIPVTNISGALDFANADPTNNWLINGEKALFDDNTNSSFLLNCMQGPGLIGAQQYLDDYLIFNNTPLRGELQIALKADNV